MNALNMRFYAENAASFSETRAGGWPGWGRMLEELRGAGCAWADTLRAGTCSAERTFDVRIVDAACGNLRFERWLAETLPDVAFQVSALDNCADLAGAVPAFVDFRSCDILGALIEGDGDWRAALENAADLAVSFGFLHHVPTAPARARFACQLLDCVRPGGFGVLTLWRFASSGDLLTKAQATTAAGLDALGLRTSDLDAGDYLVGWQDRPNAYRYCHSFDEADIEGLIAAVADTAQLVARFRADGRTGDLNEYLIFQRR